MSDVNPYQAPRAEIGAGFAGGDVATALADFTRSRGPLLGFAVVLGAMALVGVGSTMYAFASFGGGFSSATAMTLLFMGVSVGGNLLGAAAVLWLRRVLAGLDATTTVTQLTTVLRRLGNFWLLVAVLWCAPVLANLAITAGLWAFPLLGAAVAGLPGDNALVAAAARWRNMVRLCLVVAGLLILLKVGTQVVTPIAVSGFVAIESQVYLFGGVLVQLAFGAVAWRQVPVLDAFIAQPSTSTLTMVAAAHRLFWRVAAWGALAVLALNVVSSLVMGLVF